MKVESDGNKLERNESVERKVNPDLFEEDPSGEPLIEVKNLRKVFKSMTGIWPLFSQDDNTEKEKYMVNLSSWLWISI